jgi:hypothetical protein
MEKISPLFCSPKNAARGLFDLNLRFSHKVLWNRFNITLAKDPFSYFNKETFIHELVHEKAFFVFDHSNDPINQRAFVNFAKPFLDIFKEHNIDTNRIIVLSPCPDPFFYQHQDYSNYVSPNKNTPLKKQFYHIQHTYLWRDTQGDYLYKSTGKYGKDLHLHVDFDKKPKKHFLCLSRRDGVSRRFINYKLHKLNIFNKGIVSHQRIFEEPTVAKVDQRRLELRQFSSKPDFDVKFFLKSAYLKHYIDTPTDKANAANSLQLHQDLSLKTCFEIVNETDVFTTLFFTEKTLKPILNKTPFLLCGSPFTLAYLKKLGFETFSNIFDESYDIERSFYERASLLMENAKRLCELDLLTCHKQVNMCRDIVEHNYNHFLNSDWSFDIINKIQSRIDEVYKL